MPPPDTLGEALANAGRIFRSRNVFGRNQLPRHRAVHNRMTGLRMPGNTDAKEYLAPAGAGTDNRAAALNAA
jgi:hypothetical protein